MLYLQKYEERYFILNSTAFRGMRRFSSLDNKDSFKNKETYIMSRWVVDFPTHSELTYEDVSSLSSRSRDIGKWFKKTSEEFILFKEAPDWFLASGRKASDWTQEIQDKFAIVKNLNREFAAKTNEISKEAKAKMDLLNSTHKDKLVSVLGEAPELVFELINSQMLPFETHLKAFEFTSKEEAQSFISSELTKFKERKYREFLSGELSSSELVNLLFEK